MKQLSILKAEKLKIITTVLVFLAILLLPSLIPAEAQIRNPVNVTSLNQYVETAAAALIRVLVPVMVLFLVLSGVMFATARGNPEKLKQAKSMILYTAIGSAIVLGAWLLAAVVTETLNLVVGS